MVSVLIDEGANVDAQNSFVAAALYCGMSKGDGDIVRTLVEAGADFKIADAFVDSALRLEGLEGDQETLQNSFDASGGQNTFLFTPWRQGRNNKQGRLGAV